MAAQKFHADYDELAQIAQRFGREAEAEQRMVEAVRSAMQTLEAGDWQGQGARAFYAEMNSAVLPSLNRMVRALASAQRVTAQVGREVKAGEDAAAAVLKYEGIVGMAAIGTLGSVVSNTIDLAKSALDAVSGLRSMTPLVAAAVLAAGLRQGSTYAGQILLTTPQWAKSLGLAQTLRSEVGLAKTLSHIKADNLAGHLSKNAGTLGKITVGLAVAQGVISIADTWSDHWSEYQSYGSTTKQASAMVVDGALAALPVATGVAGGVLGAKGGAFVGAAIGTAICPGVGTAIGGLLGGAVGGFIGGNVGDRIGRLASDKIIESGLRDTAINWTDNNIAQPIGNAATSVVDYVDRQVSKPVADFISGGANRLGFAFN